MDIDMKVVADGDPRWARFHLLGRGRPYLLGLACVALWACGDSQTREPANGGGEGADAGGEDVCEPSGLDFETGDVAGGATVFMTICAECHGADGKGQPGATSPVTRGINLHEEIAEPLPDDCWAEVVRNGYGDMVPVYAITDQKIVDVLAYMKATFGHP